jgi:hypothetical protein
MMLANLLIEAIYTQLENHEGKALTNLRLLGLSTMDCQQWIVQCKLHNSYKNIWILFGIRIFGYYLELEYLDTIWN